MNSAPPSSAPPPPLAPARLVPLHWTPEQALAVFECLHAMREALWDIYGSQVQQAWCEQNMPEGPLPEFDPDEPF
jgi:hypothetical protein